MKLQSEKEVNIVVGKIICGKASVEELQAYVEYVGQLESLVEEASVEDFYGTEGWRHRIFENKDIVSCPDCGADLKYNSDEDKLTFVKHKS